MKTGKHIIFILLALAAFTFSSCNKRSDKPAEIKIVSSETSSSGAAAPAPAVPAQPVSLSISSPSKRDVSLSGDGSASWTSVSGGKTLSLSLAGSEYTLQDGSGIVAKGKLNGEKLKLKSANGQVFLEIKMKADKIKISLDGNTEPWSIKFKPDKIKVYENETSLGGVKYKPDTGKLKAKDNAENEIAMTRDVKQLYAFPAPYLIAGLDQLHKDALSLILYSLNK